LPRLRARVVKRARLGTAVLLGLLALAPAAAADVFVLAGGDRVSGKIVVKNPKSISVQTPYGRLTIPRSKIEKIVHDDGSEEVLNPSLTPAVEPPSVHLIVVITGKTFWYAWDPPKEQYVNATLRLEAFLDEENVAVYADPHLDPQDIPKATVNSFSFAPEDIVATPAKGVQVLPPETRPGRIVLRIELPAERAGKRRLRLAYQVDDGNAAQPAWRDVAATTAELELKVDTPTFVQVQQDAGKMEFSGFARRRMKHVETFQLQARPERAE